LRLRACLLCAVLVFLCIVAVTRDAGAAASPGTDRESAIGVVVVQVSTTSTRGQTGPLWAIQIGDTRRSEQLSEYFSHSAFLGPNCVNAVVWVRTDGHPGWVKTDYKRPQGADDFMDFVRDPAPFTTRAEDIPLPPVLDAFAPAQAAQVSYIVEYHDGGTKIYLQGGISRSDAEKLAALVSVARDYLRT